MRNTSFRFPWRLPAARAGLSSFILALTLTLPAAESGRRGAARADSLQAICERLEIGPGAVVADVGCGGGTDSLTFAKVVGERGTVFAQEIDSNKLKQVLENAQKQSCSQLVPVLGQGDDPRLPDGLLDLIYMNRVFHHFAQPQAMLARMQADLKPGGYLVIVDQKKGPMTDWTPLAKREEEHHWTGETTVVRLAREAGLQFHAVLEDVWHEEQPFVLAFRKPAKAAAAGDPDLPKPLKPATALESLPLAEAAGGAVAFVGLDRGRALLPELRTQLPESTPLFDVVLEEWAVSREELPPGAPVSGVDVVRVVDGKLAVPEGRKLKLVVFADSYHRLWDPQSMLATLKDNLADSATVAVLDRKGPDDESRRLAGHHRRVAARAVLDDFEQAGFRLLRKVRAPSSDRFYLLFERKQPAS